MIQITLTEQDLKRNPDLEKSGYMIGDIITYNPNRNREQEKLNERWRALAAKG